MADNLTSLEDLQGYLSSAHNWERWPHDPEAGAITLIDGSKRVQAAGLIRSGRAVSMSRPYPVEPGAANPHPAQQHLHIIAREDGSGTAVDYYGLQYHGYQATHIDALCHVWNEDGVMWGGYDRESVLTTDGSRWGGIERWRHGILTRALVADIPRYRGRPYVDLDSPIEGDEIRAALAAEGLAAQPGDALIVRGGREAFEEANPVWQPYADPHPGLAVSCIKYLHEEDISVVCWDMMDAKPNPLGTYRTIHRAIYAFGVALVDNCSLTDVCTAAADEGRYECALFVAPLEVRGGTGSPVNPIAVF
jgi:kynurenine formamidase